MDTDSLQRNDPNKMNDYIGNKLKQMGDEFAFRQSGFTDEYSSDTFFYWI